MYPPPGTRARATHPADLEVLPGDKVLVEVGIVSLMELNDEGQIVQQIDRLAEGGGGYMYNNQAVAGTVARFEFLMARRLPGEVGALPAISCSGGPRFHTRTTSFAFVHWHLGASSCSRRYTNQLSMNPKCVYLLRQLCVSMASPVYNFI